LVFRVLEEEIQLFGHCYLVVKSRLRVPPVGFEFERSSSEF
jgi:hypothetical protein